MAAGLAPAQPKRIVSTAPSITEMLFALGLGDRVVGRTKYCRYPEAAKKIPEVGTYIQPNVEVILSLRPDLVVIQENPARLKEKFQAVRLEVLELKHTTVDDIFKAVSVLGRVTGVQSAAETLNRKMREELDSVRRKTEPLPKRRMMFVVGRTPNAIEGIIVVGKASYLNELIGVAGGVNIFADSVSPYPKVSLEEILARDPEVIVDMGDMSDTVGVTTEQKQRVVQLWQRYPTIGAVKRDGVYAVASDHFVVPGPRMVDAALEFARMLHPETDF
jgi:iron complex transport system substrate-binding protein